MEKLIRDCSRPQRWSIFQSDGMVNVFFFKATIDVNGFENIEPSQLDLFLWAQPLVSMVFRWAMVNGGFEVNNQSIFITQATTHRILQASKAFSTEPLH